jgi:hypothetical protein
MNHPILDGKCHPLDDKLGYIGRRIDPASSINQMEKVKDEIISEYITYLLRNDLEFCVNVIKEYLLFRCNESDKFIYRPPYLLGALAQTGSLAYKFQRSENDGLQDEI